MSNVELSHERYEALMLYWLQNRPTKNFVSWLKENRLEILSNGKGYLLVAQDGQDLTAFLLKYA